VRATKIGLLERHDGVLIRETKKLALVYELSSISRRLRQSRGGSADSGQSRRDN
jgi:hypothetical protein